MFLPTIRRPAGKDFDTKAEGMGVGFSAAPATGSAAKAAAG